MTFKGLYAACELELAFEDDEPAGAVLPGREMEDALAAGLAVDADGVTVAAPAAAPLAGDAVALRLLLPAPPAPAGGAAGGTPEGT